MSEATNNEFQQQHIPFRQQSQHQYHQHHFQNFRGRGYNNGRGRSSWGRGGRGGGGRESNYALADYVSPEMWGDPWEELMTQFDQSTSSPISTIQLSSSSPPPNPASS